jgi:hypothetical protein
MGSFPCQPQGANGKLWNVSETNYSALSGRAERRRAELRERLRALLGESEHTPELHSIEPREDQLPS